MPDGGQNNLAPDSVGLADNTSSSNDSADHRNQGNPVTDYFQRMMLEDQAENSLLKAEEAFPDGYDPSKFVVPDSPNAGTGLSFTPHRGNLNALKSGNFGPSPLASQTIGNCARAVREELERKGISMAGHPATAAGYVQYFSKRGDFTSVASGYGESVQNDYVPKDHDVAVFYDPTNPGNPGHIVIYHADCKRWVSDFDPVDQGFRHTFSGLAHPENYKCEIFRNPQLALAGETKAQPVRQGILKGPGMLG
jgi:hypothetical protein